MSERRRRSRRTGTPDPELRISIARPGAPPIELDAKMIDSSDWGIGIESSRPLVVGVWVEIWGPGINGAAERADARRARVVYCRTVDDHRYRAGCAFEGAPQVDSSPVGGSRSLSVDDLYEVLQVNPAADQDAMHRVYRILAQRYHPDNPETGNQSAFQAVLNAYEVLSDPEKRAAYDVSYQAAKNVRWEIFEQPSDVEGVEVQRRMRAGILSALYQLKVKDPESHGITLRELEELLGCPREHMEFPVWYLRRKELISTASNGRFEITVAGCDAAEEFHAQGVGPTAARMKELPAPDGERMSEPAAV